MPYYAGQYFKPAPPWLGLGQAEADADADQTKTKVPTYVWVMAGAFIVGGLGAFARNMGWFAGGR